jgi:formylmethanofuran dehydrogenase subunit B
LLSLRAGGNQTGAESALTWQTGFPISVDFSRGYPRYVPEDRGLDRLKAGALNAALVLGSCSFDQAASTALGRIDSIAIGPRASQLGFPTRVAIDTGVAGIHDGGVGYRMDEVPLPLRPPLQARRSTLETLGALTRAIKSFRLPA